MLQLLLLAASAAACTASTTESGGSSTALPDTVPPNTALPSPDVSSPGVSSMSSPNTALPNTVLPSPDVSKGNQPGLAAVVERVVDGDTIIVAIGDQTETVRLLGIDTPEKAGGPRPAECFGSDASAYAEQLLPAGTVVLLSRDRETRDQYSRLLAFVHRADDGLFVNLAMLEGGYAVPLFFSPNTSLQDPFRDAANAARRNWIGLWPACGAPDVALPS